ncbi:GtrA family protein [Pseudomonas protegens]|uniref:GtrA family protein n=1 Tax=Pseudomonas protegens TaxID=380021 RepID=UPI00301CE1F0
MQRQLIQFTRYLLVGGLTYGADLSVFLLLFNVFEMDLLIANMISKVLAGVFSFAAHRAFTFGVTDAKGGAQQAVRYFTLLALNIPLSALILSALLWITSMEVVAKILADILLIFISYAQSKLIVFKRSETSHE